MQALGSLKKSGAQKIVKIADRVDAMKEVAEWIDQRPKTIF